jgi:predicted glutamine amidotransferase
MCGIVGFVSTKYGQHNPTMFKQLLLWDAVRGADSTGVAVIKPDERTLFKKALNSSDFVQLKGYEALAQKMSAQSIVIGHNRSSTIGETKDANAHPFIEDHITMVHNGSVRNFRTLNSGSDSNVDSAHICAAIAKFGAEDVLPQLDGPAVLVWHDNKKNTFNFFRNEKRELSYAFDKDGTMWFASEWPMLYALALRNNIIIVDDYAFDNVSTDTWITFDMKDITKPDVKKVHKKTSFFPMSVRAESKWDRGTGAPIGHSTSGISQQDNSKGTPSTSTATKGATNKQVQLYELDSKNKIKRANKHLVKWGLSIGQTVQFRPVSWNGNNRPDYVVNTGTLSGTINGGTVQCRMFNVPNDYWQVWVENITNKEWTMEAHVINFLVEKEQIGRAKTYHREIVVAKPNPSVLLPAPNSKDNEDVEYLDGPGGVKVSVKKFEDMTKHGCAQCSGDIGILDHLTIEWVGSPAAPLCASCSIDVRRACNAH